eukprot:133937_1
MSVDLSENVIDPRVWVTCSAPSNIAVIKYWGKRDLDLNLPLNGSISMTLDQDEGELCTITTVAASPKFKTNRFWLNGKPDLSIEQSPRFTTVLTAISRLASDRVDPDTGEVVVRKEDWANLKFHISSKNTFPTAAGLASSAAGFAALTFAVAELMCAVEEFPGQLTTIARQGSGSASRSLTGGIVRWDKGTLKDGTDSLATQIVSENEWPSLRAFVLIASSKEKHTASTSGMATSARTSEFLKYRAKELVEDKMLRMEQACINRDFATFAEMTMKDSNQFHATCADTYPPIFYLNEVSHGIIQAIHCFNLFYEELKAAYTFDAGPNAVIIVQEKDATLLLSFLLALYPPPSRVKPYLRFLPFWSKFMYLWNFPTVTMQSHMFIANLDLVRQSKCFLIPPKLIYAAGGRRAQGDVEKIYCTGIGCGPKILKERKPLLNMKTGINTVIAGLCRPARQRRFVCRILTSTVYFGSAAGLALLCINAFRNKWLALGVLQLIR